MAKFIRNNTLFWVIALTAAIVNAAVLQTKETIDLDGTSNKNEQTVASYRSIEPEHLAAKEPKVIIDLYTPQQPYEIKSSEFMKDEDNVTPFAELVINQPNVSDLETHKHVPNSSNQVPNTTANQLQLIPPAFVNASIDKIDPESKQEQGKIIIRYVLFFSLIFLNLNRKKLSQNIYLNLGNL